MSPSRSGSPAVGSHRTPRAVTVQAGPWTVLDDSYDTAHAGPNVAQQLYNVLSLDAGSTIGRPGCTYHSTQGGAGGNRTPQCHFQLTTALGTEVTGRIVGGKLETATWAASVITGWANTVTAANFATASITVSASARIAVIQFADKLIFSDGVNKPWQWDGTAGAGGLLSLTVASVWYGVPVVRDAQVIAIRSSDRRTIEWSAVNDATSGYNTQNWTLAQISETGLTALAAFNDVLIVFRARMCQPIYGKVNATFATNGTRATLSENIGTLSPFAVTIWDNRCFFIDADGRPQALSASAGSVTYAADTTETPGANAGLWQRLRETCKTVDRSKLTAASAVIFIPLQLVLLGVARTTTDTNPGMWFVLDPKAVEPRATWGGFEFLAPANVKDGAGAPQLAFGDANGYSYTYYDMGTSTVFNDILQTGTAAITHQIVATPLADDRALEVNWYRADVLARAATDQHLGLSVRTPNGTSSAQSFVITGNSFVFGVSLLGTGKLGENTTEKKATVGLGSHGRFISPTITHSTLSEQFGIVGVRLEGVVTRDDPAVK